MQCGDECPQLNLAWYFFSWSLISPSVLRKKVASGYSNVWWGHVSNLPPTTLPQQTVSPRRQAIDSDLHPPHIVKLRGVLNPLLVPLAFVNRQIGVDEIDVSDRFQIWRWRLRAILQDLLERLRVNLNAVSEPRHE